MNIGLTPQNVEQIAGRNLTFMTSKEISKINDISNIIERAPILLLYLNAQNSGHWVCVQVDNMHKTIEFFDPYGLEPDSEYGYVPPAYHFRKNMERLLEKEGNREGYIVKYNSVHLQKMARGDDVCGRWVGYRIRRHELSLSEFNNMFINVKDRDGLIVKITNKYLSL